MYFKYVYLLLWPFPGRKIVLKFESQKEAKNSHYFIKTLYALEIQMQKEINIDLPWQNKHLSNLL